VDQFFWYELFERNGTWRGSTDCEANSEVAETSREKLCRKIKGEVQLGEVQLGGFRYAAFLWLCAAKKIAKTFFDGSSFLRKKGTR